jgi:ubiquinone/menaquinone biosynthesis C-methylase UbiE
MPHQKFDIARLERLNDPARLETQDPALLWRALGSPSPCTMVEIGAGTGLFAARFLEMSPGSVLYAVDIEPLMIEWMTANRPEVAEGRLRPVLGTETKVPLPDAVADLVFMLNLHHELADPPATYAEAHRVLRDGGQVLVVDWAPVESPGGPPFAMRVDAGTIARVLEDAGFTEVVTHPRLPYASLLTAVKP